MHGHMATDDVLNGWPIQAGKTAFMLSRERRRREVYDYLASVYSSEPIMQLFAVDDPKFPCPWLGTSGSVIFIGSAKSLSKRWLIGKRINVVLSIMGPPEHGARWTKETRDETLQLVSEPIMFLHLLKFLHPDAVVA